MTEPNFGNGVSSIGPKNSENMNSTSSIAAFQTMGPMATTAIRMSGLAGCLPSLSGNDLTNMYAMTKSTAIMIGKMTSEKMTARHLARGTSPESLSEG